MNTLVTRRSTFFAKNNSHRADRSGQTRQRIGGPAIRPARLRWWPVSAMILICAAVIVAAEPLHAEKTQHDSTPPSDTSAQSPSQRETSNDDEQRANAASIQGQAQRIVSVGMSGRITQVVMPGSRLKPADVDPRRTPIMVRVDRVYPHGDDFRYDLTWFGFVPGEYNLSDFLAREDGSSTTDLPALPVTVQSVLSSGRSVPHEVSPEETARPGGYRIVATVAVVVWVLGLLAILLTGRRRRRSEAGGITSEAENPVAQLQTLIDRAREAGSLNAAEKAELEMRVIGLFRQRYHLQDRSAAESLALLKDDQDAGPLLAAMEKWFYSQETPDGDDVAEMLLPLRKLVDQPPVALQNASEGTPA